MTAKISPRPSVPPPYVGGMLTIAPNTVFNLLTLIQQQIEWDCPGTSVEFLIWADPTNMAPVYFGSSGRLSGKLSTTHYAFQLTPMAEPRLYRSSYPGNQTAIGRLEVFSQAPAKIHVEVVE